MPILTCRASLTANSEKRHKWQSLINNNKMNPWFVHCNETVETIIVFQNKISQDTPSIGWTERQVCPLLGRLNHFLDSQSYKFSCFHISSIIRLKRNSILRNVCVIGNNNKCITVRRLEKKPILLISRI